LLIVCGSIVCFRGGKVGFVRMELKAKCHTKFTHRKRNWGQIGTARID
jgi:hypothetical protein